MARRLGVGVELHFLDAASPRTLAAHRSTELGATLGQSPDPSADFDRWAVQFQAPDAAELILFDAPPN